MRQPFAESVCEAFAKTTHATVKQWIVSREMHANTTDSTSANIFHYHVARSSQLRQDIHLVAPKGNIQYLL